MGAAVLALLLAPDARTITDEEFDVPAKEWRYLAVTIEQVPVTVSCNFEVTSGPGVVRVALVNGDGLDDLKEGKREPLGAGAFARQGTFRRAVRVPDDYFVVLENSGQGPARVRLRSTLDFSGRDVPQARTLSPQRRLAVIGISAFVFLGIVSYSARKLSAVMRR